MKILLKKKMKETIGEKRQKNKFLWFPKILYVSEKSNDVELRWLCKATWIERMDEWLSTPIEGPSRGSYSPGDLTPDTYGWRAKYWKD